MTPNFNYSKQYFQFEMECNGKKQISAAFPEGAQVKLTFKISRRKGAFNFRGELYDDERCAPIPLEITWITNELGFDVYTAYLPKNPVGIYFLRCGYDTDHGYECFFFPDGMDVMNVTVHTTDFKTPSWLKGGIMYQIFVDRFAKSEKHRTKQKERTVMIDDWDNGIPQYPEKPGDAFANNCFFGGSLYGIIEKLDYLASLGVNTLYLNPIFDAASNHKYDTADYMTVDEMFGGEEALDLLIAELKKRDMHLILDGVFNHTGADSIYFNKFGNYDSLGAYQSKKSPYYDWFDFKKHPDDYNCWWGVKILPCLKKDSTGFRKYICGKDGVAAHYIRKGVDGFRLDVADELSNEFLYELRDTARGINPEAVIYGEVWEDASEKVAYDHRRKYFFGRQLDGVMNYPLRDAIIDYVITSSCEKLASVSSSLYMHYPKCVSDVQMNLLGTHDTERILNVLSGENTCDMTNRQLSTYKLPKSSRERATSLLKIAVFLNYTLPGVPCIYYGDEAGMEGGRDPFNRMPYPYGREDLALIDFYRSLGKIRSENKDLKDGVFEILTAEAGLFVFRRNDTVCACNRGEARIFTSDKPFKNSISGKSTELDPRGRYIYKLEMNEIAIFKK